MLGQDGHGHILQKGHIGGGEPEGHRFLIDDGNLLHVLVVGGVLRAVFRVHNGLDGEPHVLCGEGLAVVPLDPVSDVEGVGAGLLVVLPALRQAGRHLVVPVVGGQAVEEQGVDLAVLVHSGVDAGIIRAAVDQGAPLRPAGGVFGTAAGGQGEGERCGQQQGENLFHRYLLVWVLFVLPHHIRT